MKLMNFDWDEGARDTLIHDVKAVEKAVKDQGDELIFIVTTRDTNPMKDSTAPPMSEKDIKA